MATNGSHKHEIVKESKEAVKDIVSENSPEARFENTTTQLAELGSDILRNITDAVINAKMPTIATTDSDLVKAAREFEHTQGINQSVYETKPSALDTSAIV